MRGVNSKISRRKMALPPRVRVSVERLLLLACLLFWGLPESASPPAEDSDSYVISRDVSLVVLPVTVIDRERQFVSGLDASNFRIYEQGRPQTLTLFEREDRPVTAGLVVDHSGSMYSRKMEVIEGAAAFVQASNPQDEEFVVNFSDKARLGLPPDAPFTSNIEDLKEALSAASASGMTALYDAVATALDHLRNAHKAKRTLILITDGEDNASKRDLNQVLRMAQALNVVIYTVGLFDQYKASKTSLDPYVVERNKLLFDEDKRVLTMFARETGGAAYFPNNFDEVVRVCQQIASDIRHQYVLGYSPTDDGRGGFRRVNVKVVGSGQEKLVVRTRTGYLLPAKHR
jgi:VWFA-related protein